MPDRPHSKSRRAFVGKSIAGSGLILGAPSIISAEAKNSPSNQIRVAFIGCGKQQEVLFNAMQNLPGLRFVAACDIMKNRLGRAYGSIRHRFDYKINRYFEAEDMFAKEDAIDAVFVATPDFWHAPHAVMALEAGCHVYCETMMSNTLKGTQSILQAAGQSGKLCQIGYHRRSHPVYRYVLEQLVQKHDLLGEMMRVEAQRFRSIPQSMDIMMHPKMIPDEDLVKQYGFKNSYEFLNWRFIPRLSAGLTSEFSAHQIDVFNWYLGTTPQKVYASGTRSHFVERECFDTINTLLDYKLPTGNLQAVQRVSGTSVSKEGYFEAFNGINGSAQLSEKKAFQAIFRACGTNAEAWHVLVQRGYLKYDAEAFGEIPIDRHTSWDAICHETINTRGNPYYKLPGETNRPPHSYHLENFFEAIRGNAALNCDAKTGYATDRVLHAMTKSTGQETAVELELGESS